MSMVAIGPARPWLKSTMRTPLYADKGLTSPRLAFERQFLS
jgi:hypothetical protein